MFSVGSGKFAAATADGMDSPPAYAPNSKTDKEEEEEEEMKRKEMKKRRLAKVMATADAGWDGFTACVRSQLKNG